MFTLKNQIIIHNSRSRMIVRQVGEVEVHTSVDRFTDTARVTLPRLAKVRGMEERNLTKIIQRNDKIEIRLGYDDRLDTVFKGYIRSVSSRNPMVLECENEAWELKQKMPTENNLIR